MSIPVIGVPVTNSTFWVSRLLTSIDYPVDEVFIVNNNGRGELDEDLAKLASLKYKYIKKVKVANLPGNLGVSGAWNLIIKCYVMAPYWIICNDDVSFCPGFLEEMMNTADSDPMIGMVHGNKGDYGVGSWDLFLIKESIVRQFGLFDENLYPAYCEDADMIMRFIHRPIKKVIELESQYYHGFGKKDEYYTHGSQTKKTEPELAEKLERSNMLNIDYLTEKWGANWRVQGPTYLPWEGDSMETNPNGDARRVSSTTFDLDFIRSKHLGF